MIRHVSYYVNDNFSHLLKLLEDTKKGLTIDVVIYYQTLND